MADGDEKIDQNDRIPILNRVVCSCKPEDDPRRCTAPTTIKFAGIDVTWKPGGTRYIQREEAGHFLLKSELKADPTGSYFPHRRLVMIDDAGQPVEEGASVELMTEAQAMEIAKGGWLDPTNLPPDRMLGGKMLIDPETGEGPTGTELRGNPHGRDISAPPLAFQPVRL